MIKAGYKASKEELALAGAARKGPPFTPPGPPPMIPPVAGCCQVKRIAPKADIIKARAEIKKMLVGGLAFTTPQLDAAITAERRTRK